MATRIGLIGDVHAGPTALKQALTLFASKNVSDIICVGDIAGYFETLSPTIQLLKHHRCKTVMGNHDQAWLAENPDQQDSENYAFLSALPDNLELTIENKTIYVVHAHPPSSQHGGIKLLDVNGDVIKQNKLKWSERLTDFEYDVLIVGHTHQVFAEQLGNVFVVNPGSSQFNHSCMILTLPDLTVETYALEQQEILKSWNFSMLFTHPTDYPPAKKIGHD